MKSNEQEITKEAIPFNGFGTIALKDLGNKGVKEPTLKDLLGCIDSIHSAKKCLAEFANSTLEGQDYKNYLMGLGRIESELADKAKDMMSGAGKLNSILPV